MQVCTGCYIPWRRHQMETVSVLLAICARNSPTAGEFPAQRPMARGFVVLFDLRLNKRLRLVILDVTAPIMTSLQCPHVRKIKGYYGFLHDRPWISPWIKSISNELDMTIHVITSQLSGYFDVIKNRLWHHQQNVNPARGRCVKIVVFIVILSSLCRVRTQLGK